MFNNEALRHWGEYIAYNQALTTSLTAGNGTNGANPHTAYNMNGQFGVTVSASKGATVSVPAGGTVTVGAVSDNGSSEQLVWKNTLAKARVFSNTQEIEAFIFSPAIRGQVTVSIASTGTGTVDVNPSYRTR
jgi:hypothetical protein